MKLKKRISLILFFLSIYSSLYASSEEEKSTFSGWYKSQLYLSNSSSKNFANSGQIKFDYQFDSKSSFESAYILSLIYNYDQSNIVQAKKYRYTDLHQSIMSDKFNGAESSLVAYQNLNRFSYLFSNDKINFAAGRGPLSFGAARYINPTDIIVPYSLWSIDKEEREGSDYIRFRRSISQMDEIDIGFVFGEHGHIKNDAYYFNIKYPLFNYDLSLMYMRFKEHDLYGFDMQGSIMSMGVWLEGAQVITNDKYDNYLRLSVGSDYNFTQDLYSFIEYHYNGAGTSNQKRYLINSKSSAYFDGNVYLFAKDYLIWGANYSLTPLISLNESTVINLNDFSLFLSPKLAYNASENSYIDFGALIPIGRKGNSVSELISEFGSYSKSIYITYRMYF